VEAEAQAGHAPSAEGEAMKREFEVTIRYLIDEEISSTLRLEREAWKLMTEDPELSAVRIKVREVKRPAPVRKVKR
jgi:hypothetical protein